jgi:hypothetical protein
MKTYIIEGVQIAIKDKEPLNVAKNIKLSNKRGSKARAQKEMLELSYANKIDRQIFEDNFIILKRQRASNQREERRAKRH